MSKPIALELEHVSVRREDRVVIDDVSLAVTAGTVHALIGPHGAGKSTVLAAVLGQVAFAGAIRIRFRRDGRIGYVPQSFAVDRALPVTIADFLALARQRWPVCLGVTRAARARIEAILERVGLAGMAHRRLGELSTGELRRVLIGNAIEPAPELLLCDEPATGLDPDTVGQLDRELAALRDDHGTTVLIVSHDRAQVQRIANRVTVLDGTLRRTGPPDEVLAEEPQ